MDIEKIIKALECRNSFEKNDLSCLECPYFIDDIKHPYCNYHQLLEDTIKELKDKKRGFP